MPKDLKQIFFKYCGFFLLFLLLILFPVNKTASWEIEYTSADPQYAILIDAENCMLYVVKNGVNLKSFPCAAGESSKPSPIGTWHIIGKGRWGDGFGGHWMGLDCPWGKFGIHGTSHPETIGKRSSGGCIRMYNKDAAELYNYVGRGTMVTIIDGPYGDFGKGFRNIKPGMYGSDVLAVQKRLKELNYYKGALSGNTNSKGFIAAVNSYQKDNGLLVTNSVTPKMQSALGFVLCE